VTREKNVEAFFRKDKKIGVVFGSSKISISSYFFGSAFPVASENFCGHMFQMKSLSIDGNILTRLRDLFRYKAVHTDGPRVDILGCSFSTNSDILYF